MSKRDKVSSRSSGKAAVFDPQDFPRGDNAPFERVYREHYRAFIAWAVKRWGLEEDVLAEAFNEALLVFRRKAWDGSLDNYAGKQVNTVLFAIGANLVRNRIKTDTAHQQRFEPLDEEHAQIEEETAFSIPPELQQGIFAEGAGERVQALRKSFGQLTERCQQILLRRIVHGQSMPEIAEALGIGNANSAKTAKNKCLNRLKQLMGLQ